jgi:hypothetical protein
MEIKQICMQTWKPVESEINFIGMAE